MKFDIKDLGKLRYFLGMSVVQDLEKRRPDRTACIHRKATDQDGDE